MIINLNAIAHITLSANKKSAEVRMQDGLKFTCRQHFWALYMLLSHEKGGFLEGVPYSLRKLTEGVYLVEPFK